MKSHDEDEQSPSAEELREAAALAAALDGGAAATADPAGASPSADLSGALEAAALLRQARTPLAVPAAHEAIVAAHVGPALDARRASRRRRGRLWITASVIAPAAAAAWLLFVMTANYERSPALRPSPPPAPSADLLAAQAQATRGGNQTTGALAALDLKMRAYRRQYHEALKRTRGGEP